MEFVEYDPDILEKTRFGLLEPNEKGKLVDQSEIDLIHVPGLVFQSKGYRIGYGGGAGMRAEAHGWDSWQRTSGSRCRYPGSTKNGCQIERKDI